MVNLTNEQQVALIRVGMYVAAGMITLLIIWAGQ